MRASWSFATAGQIVFGPGAVRRLGQLARQLRLNRVLLITDPQLVELGIADQVVDPLAAEGIAVEACCSGEPEPALGAVEAGLEHAERFQPQAFLGLGGGSNMDLAKIVATIFSHRGTPQDYFGFNQIPGPIRPLICVPTTAGTGSEVSHAAVITDTQNQMKVSTLSPFLRPKLAVVDPVLSYSCPRQVTADSGIDALTHAIEAYTATDFDRLPVPPGETCAYEGRFPLGERLAEHAIELIGQHLVAACSDPQNAAAREGMSLAATLAGMAFSNCGVALVHALEYPLGAALHCSHGAGNGLLLPHVMRFNLPHRKRSLARIAQLLGRTTAGLSEDQAAELAITAVDELRRQIGVPGRIRDLGGTAAQLPQFAAKAFAVKRLLWVNPRTATQEDLLAILQAAF